jgi:hypothetical protein
VFGGPYKWTVIESVFHCAHARRYVAQNPVRAVVNQRVEDDRYSSFHEAVTVPLVAHPF